MSNKGSHGEELAPVPLAPSHGAAAARREVLVSPPILFCDRGCPFSHRVLALLAHQQIDVERHESPVGHEPEGLQRYSTTGQLPLLAHESLVLTESRVMLEYLAERYALPGAYPKNTVARARHRYAMALVDNILPPLLFGSRRATDGDPLLANALRALEEATAGALPQPSLLAFHVGPFWHAFRAWQPSGTTVREIEKRTSLHRWLEAVAQLECVTSTAIAADILSQDIRRAREAGLLGPEPT